MTAMRLALAAGIFAFSFATTAQAEYIGPPKAVAPETQMTAPAPQATNTLPPDAQYTPPVFKDATGAAPPPLPAGTPGNTVPPPATTTTAATPPVEVPPDPCAGSMGNIDAYNACQDMMQKIERMKKGNASRRETYYPKPPPEVKKPEPVAAEAPKPAEGAPKTEPKPGEAAAPEVKKDGATAATPAPVVESPRVIGNK